MPIVHFPQTEPTYRPETDVVVFDIVVDGVQHKCEISAEALNNLARASSMEQKDLLRIFKQYRATIEAVGRLKLPNLTAAGRGLLVSQDFNP